MIVLPLLKSLAVAIAVIAQELASEVSRLLLESTPMNSVSKFLTFDEWKRSHMSPTSGMQSTACASAATLTSNACGTPTPSLYIGSKDLAIASIDSASNSTLDLPAKSKIYKDKFNYASAECAATVVETNAQARSAGAILRENKDTYLLNECTAPSKYVVIELCQEILVRQVVVGNFEFFSSMSRLLRILVSDVFPATSWHVLGEFEASNVRDLQRFDIESPILWARYLKLEVLSHYGNEFYCPLSIVRVHGKTMMEDFKDELPPTTEPPLKDILLNNTPSEITTSRDCSVLLPYLGLNEFLKDRNSTLSEYCDVNEMYYANPDSETTSQSQAKTTQELIFKNILKRLNLLENNASLSLLYMEEQNRVVSRAFSDLEQKLRITIDQLVSAVNETVLGHLGLSKMLLAQQQADLAASSRAQRNLQRAMDRETRHRLDALANELVLQQRFSWLNSAVVVCLLVYVILTRDAGVDEVAQSSARAQNPRRSPQFAVGSLKRSKIGRVKRYRR